MSCPAPVPIPAVARSPTQHRLIDRVEWSIVNSSVDLSLEGRFWVRLLLSVQRLLRSNNYEMMIILRDCIDDWRHYGCLREIYCDFDISYMHCRKCHSYFSMLRIISEHKNATAYRNLCHQSPNFLTSADFLVPTLLFDCLITFRVQ